MLTNVGKWCKRFAALTVKIALNAQLLSSQLGYRSAGIHGYIYNLLDNLAVASNASSYDWAYTAFVSKDNTHTFAGINMCRVALSTEYPVKRILWEQLLQPRQIHSFDIVHGLAFALPLMLNKPSVVTVYDLSFLHYPQVLSTGRRLYLRLFTEYSCRRADRVIAISHSTAQDVHKSFGISQDKIDVADCGYDRTLFKPLPEVLVTDFRRENALPERFWFFVGTLEPRKNLVTLLRAYAELPLNKRLPLYIGGSKGWLYDEIFDVVERCHLRDTVHFVGFIPSEKLPLWYNSAETFLYPSIFEGFGLPVLEAMACGTPVIVSDTSSLPEVVGNSGAKVDPLNIAEWKNALERSFDDGQWRKQASEQGLIESSRYSWQDTAYKTIGTYQKILETYE